MRGHRLIGVLVLLLASLSPLRAQGLHERMLSSGRFLDWAVLQADITDRAVDQVWRQRLYDLPRDVDGYTMVSYRVIRTDSKTEAAGIVKQLTQKKRFDDYVAKGYATAIEPWNVMSVPAVKFTVRGTDYTAERAAVAHHADIFTFAVQAESYVIWLEVRQVTTAPSLGAADRAIEKVTARPLAEDLVGQVIELWNGPREAPPVVAPSKPEGQPPIVQPPKPEEKPPVVAPPKPEEKPPVVQPPKPEEQPPAVQPPKPEDNPPVIAPPKPEEKPPLVQPPKPEEQPPVVQPPKPEEKPPMLQPPKPETQPVVPSPQPEEPVPADQRVWLSADGWLQLTIPTDWKVTGQQKVTFTGFPHATVRLFAPETYASANELHEILLDFAESQQAASRKDYTQQEFTVDGVTGLQVRYLNMLGSVMHVYCFGKAGRAWRLECEITGDKLNAAAPLPALLQRVIASLHVRPPAR